MTTETTQSPAERFEAAYAANFAGIRNFVFGRCADWHLAEDVAQEAFIDIWQQMTTGRGLDPGVSVFSALARRAQCRLYQHRKLSSTRRELLPGSCHNRREQGSEVPEEVAGNAGKPAPDKVEDAVVERIDVGAALAMLPPLQRRAVALRFLEDLPDHEVARQTGYSQSAIKNHTREALTTLRTAYGAPAPTASQNTTQLRSQAREVYATSVAAGAPLSFSALGAQFGRSPSWAKLVVGPSARTGQQSARERVLEQLRAQLEDGKYAPGERMPTCTVLAARFGIHSGQICWALRQLADLGLLERRAGRTARDSSFYVPAAAPALALVTNTYLVTGRTPTGADTFPIARLEAA